MKIALVYDHLNKVGGAEVILQAFHELYRDADWYTAVHNPNRTPFTSSWRVHSSFISRIPYLRDHHEWYPYLMPFIFESFDFSAYDLVISIGSAECKGIITLPGTYHLHYCLTPTRYLYSHADEYLKNPIYRLIGNYLRAWDQVAATRPDKMIAISEHVKKRIQKYYNRKSSVIYPPVDTKKFAPIGQLGNWDTAVSSKNNYFLTVSRLVPYKKIDLLIRAFNANGKKLIIAGVGSELSKLKKLAKSNITFIGFVKEERLIELYQVAQAFLQVNEEDFGIAIVEALASGTPVIAYNRGGAAEIVKDQETGILFGVQTEDSINQAIDRFEKIKFSAEACMKNAARFDKVIWKGVMKKELQL